MDNGAPFFRSDPACCTATAAAVFAASLFVRPVRTPSAIELQSKNREAEDALAPYPLDGNRNSDLDDRVPWGASPMKEMKLMKSADGCGAGLFDNCYPLGSGDGLDSDDGFPSGDELDSGNDFRGVLMSTRDDKRWAAVTSRNAAAAAPFVYAVKTTGVFCRPGCASRLPRRANVLFFDSSAAAMAAGYRPCLRCRPEAAEPHSPMVEAITTACRMIESAEEAPRLARLAGAVGMSPSHFHRLFTRTMGITPRAYAATTRARRAQTVLAAGASVTEAIYEAGYSASSRFYAEAPGTLGMRPAQMKGGAAGVTVRVAVAACYLGRVLVAATEQGICAIDIGDAEGALRDRLRVRFPRAQFVEDDAPFAEWVAQVVALLEAPERGLALPLDIQGTAFQRRVWEALRSIPAGTTLTYEEVAARIGAPKAARAVAGACAANALAVAVPCHRVVRADGSLGGYRWGVERKRSLLKRERQRATRPR